MENEGRKRKEEEWENEETGKSKGIFPTGFPLLFNLT